jgi:glycosyltransferase involved in cell wall biosynthesis
VRISVLVPTWNQRGTIEQAVRSALAQDHPDLEVVVGDDASSDGTADVVAALPADPRLRLHRGRHNVGRVANYRRCLRELASGDFVLMLDGDDYLTCPDYLSRAARLIEAHGAALVFGRIAMRDEATGALRETHQNHGLPELFDGDALFLRLPEGDVALFHLTCVYERRRALALDFYRADVLSSDFESLQRLIVGARVGFIDAVAGVWRRHPASAIARSAPGERLANLASITGPYLHARESGRFDEPTLRRWLARMLARKGLRDLRALLREGEHATAWAYLRELRRWSPAAAARVALDPRLLRACVRGARRR